MALSTNLSQPHIHGTRSRAIKAAIKAQTLMLSLSALVAISSHANKDLLYDSLCLVCGFVVIIPNRGKYQVIQFKHLELG